MKWLGVLLLLVVIAPAAEAQPGPTSVTVRFRGPRVGDTWKEEMFRGMVLTFDINGRQMPVTNEAIEHKTIEVLAVNGNAPTKARITYTSYSDVTRRAGGAGNKAGPPLHKPYTLTSGLPTKVESKDGPVPESEADLVREREKRFGTDDRFARALHGRTFTIDKAASVPVPDLFDDEKIKVQAMTLTYRRTANAKAEFDMTLRFVADQDGHKITTDLAGKAVIDPKTAMLHDLTLHGTVEYRGPNNGRGTMTLRYTVR
jgi:hypothetical protein